MFWGQLTAVAFIINFISSSKRFSRYTHNEGKNSPYKSEDKIYSLRYIFGNPEKPEERKAQNQANSSNSRTQNIE